MQYLQADEFLNQLDSVNCIDVRSPKEFDVGHISGAINLPVFSDDERAEIGTLYKQQGREIAIQRGLEIVQPRAGIVGEKALALSKNKKLAVYCWRGGMRSGKMAELFESLGAECWVLEDGYKAYRNQLLKDFSNIPNLVVLNGSTGSGKTDILHELEALGEQVIDLEGIAHHKGSAFGALGMETQPTTQRFQARVHKKLRSLNIESRIWIESESKCIGKICLPEPLWECMNRSTILEVSIPVETRINRLVSDYGSFDQKQLVGSVQKIERRFGAENTKRCIEYLEAGNMKEATRMLLKYYDSGYYFSRNKYKKQASIVLELPDGSPKDWAPKVLKKVAEL